jgi:nitrite reductase/ring-hydroxylating ferredoxin subunit/ectoine hydroxylase-related dioxygenase (phytanoyl-CoA dioxygenase family)
MATELIAERIGPQPSESVPLHEVVDRVTAGEVIILRRCLQHTGFMDEFQSTTRNVFEQCLGAKKAAAIMSAGLEHLHRFVTSSELTEIAKRLQADLSVTSMLMVKRVARDVLGVQGDAYAEEARNVRIFVPQDQWTMGREDYLQFERERSRGKLTLHGPHTDVWGYHPLNVINVWAAIGPVLEGNGMSVWPELFGRIPPMGEWHIARTDQVLGKPFGCALNPGDALLFHIGHMHGSRINQTEQTRYVCSARFTIGAPVLFDKPWYSYMNIDDIPEKMGAVVPPCATDSQRPAVPPSDIDTADRLPKPVAVGRDASGAPAFDSEALALGQIRPLNAAYCVARTANGVVAFSRRCPHEASDLAAGFIEGNQVVCPAHNLAIDLGTGRSACRSLAAIRILPLTEAAGQVQVASLKEQAAPAAR